MTEPDPDFERLRGAPVPAPSPLAKAAALAAASAAFEEARSAQVPKGSSEVRRLTSSTHSGWWRTSMQNRLVLGGAGAGLLMLPMAAVLFVNGGLPTAQRVSVREPVMSEGTIAPKVVPPQIAISPADPLEKDARQDPAPPSAPEQEDGGASLRLSGYPRTDNRMETAAAPVGDTLALAQPARDRFSAPQQNGTVATTQDAVSTFSIDTDTASYAWVRRQLGAGILPSPDAVRVEEMINYFPYDYARPDKADQPFRPTLAVYPTPWNPATRIVHIGIKGFDVAPAALPAANLVFLVDTSGSMAEPDKLPLVQASLKLLLDRLKPDDRVAIVTYAGEAGVALEPTRVSDRAAIVTAIDRLGAGGSTAGAAGIEEAYALARKSFVKEGVNRVILATDGDFNVGLSDDDSLTRLIEKERQSGIFLSVLGFGQGNYNDALMQRLAQNGNGSASYIDQLDEAQKVLVDEATSTLFTVAKDVKIQVEFNPATVADYRLIGYETRLLNRTDFKNDRIDAGEVGSGTTVTALYEITPTGSEAALADPLRYAGKPAADAAAPRQSELGFLKIRYKLPGEDKSRLVEQPIAASSALDSLSDASDDIRFAAAVAAFGQKLKASPATAAMGYDAILTLAEGARGSDPWGYRNGFVRLVRLAKSLSGG